MLIDNDLVTYNQWDLYDVGFLALAGISCALAIGFQNIAFKYQMASKLVPLVYIENIFTLCADLIIFDYLFQTTDLIGILLMVTFIGAPLIILKKK